MFIKPAPGLKVRDPHNPRAHVPETGRTVPDGDLEWHRLLMAGDIVETDPPAGPAAQEQ